MPCNPTSCSASFTSSSLNGLMMASIFFTERLPGTSIFETAGFFGLRVTRSLLGPRDAARPRKCRAETVDQSRLPQKQGLCQVVKGSILERYQPFNGRHWRVRPRVHHTAAYELGKQINPYADGRGLV